VNAYSFPYYGLKRYFRSPKTFFQILPDVNPVAFLQYMVAVGMPVTRHPPHRSVQEELLHTAPTLGYNAQTAVQAKGVRFVQEGARRQ
jgi:hypothetical protein